MPSVSQLLVLFRIHSQVSKRPVPFGTYLRGVGKVEYMWNFPNFVLTQVHLPRVTIVGQHKNIHERSYVKEKNPVNFGKKVYSLLSAN